MEAVLELTDKAETLLVVTADHSHAVTMAGYPDRGNPVLGLVSNPDTGYTVTAADGRTQVNFAYSRTEPVTNTTQPYTTIAYANGPGFDFHFDRTAGFWRNVSGEDFMSPDWRQMATFQLEYETHGGEDVPLYAVGPGAHLLAGVHEQSYLAHALAYAGCLRRDQLGCPAAASAATKAELVVVHWFLILNYIFIFW